MKKLAFLILFINSFLNAQIRTEISYLDSFHKDLKDSSNFIFIKTKITNDSITNKWEINTKYRNGDFYDVILYKVVDKDTFREYKTFFKNNLLKSHIKFKNKSYHGTRKTYYPNGVLKRYDLLISDSLKQGKCYDSLGNLIDYYNYHLHPHFIGGEEAQSDFFAENLEYPKQAIEYKISGKVNVIFVIEKDGTINFNTINTEEASSPDFIKNAVELIKKTSGFWEPGYIDGEPVRVRVKIPIEFSLD